MRDMSAPTRSVMKILRMSASMRARVPGSATRAAKSSGPPASAHCGKRITELVLDAAYG